MYAMHPTATAAHRLSMTMNHPLPVRPQEKEDNHVASTLRKSTKANIPMIIAFNAEEAAKGLPRPPCKPLQTPQSKDAATRTRSGLTHRSSFTTATGNTPYNSNNNNNSSHSKKRTKPRRQSGMRIAGLVASKQQQGGSVQGGSVRNMMLLMRSDSDRKILRNTLERQLVSSGTRRSSRNITRSNSRILKRQPPQGQ